MANTSMGAMELTRVIRNAGNGTYEVRHSRQDIIVNSQDILIRVNEFATLHWPLLHDKTPVTVQRRDPTGIGPSTFTAHTIEEARSVFIVEDENGVTHETQAYEMLIAADTVLNVLSPRRQITKQRPPRTPSPQHDQPLQDAHGAPPSREGIRNVEMVAKYLGEGRLSLDARG
jgi:hypothetical protein